MHSREAVYHLSHSASPIAWVFFGENHNSVNEVSPGVMACCLKAAQTQRKNFTSHLDLISLFNVPQILDMEQQCSMFAWLDFHLFKFQFLISVS
jgi:hypothetical protein